MTQKMLRECLTYRILPKSIHSRSRHTIGLTLYNHNKTLVLHMKRICHRDRTHSSTSFAVMPCPTWNCVMLPSAAPMKSSIRRRLSSTRLNGDYKADQQPKTSFYTRAEHRGAQGQSMRRFTIPMLTLTGSQAEGLSQSCHLSIMRLQQSLCGQDGERQWYLIALFSVHIDRLVVWIWTWSRPVL